MRKYVLLGLVVVALLAMTSAAFAGGYLTSVPGGGSPHGNYSDSGTKCKVCHAVHNANTGSGQEALLRSSKAGACVYCHLTNTYGVYRPYGSTEASYTTDDDWNHASNHDTFTWYKGCVRCHAVHGANAIGSVAIGGSDESTDGDNYILKADPGPIPTGQTTGGALAANAQNQINFCRDCHNKSGNNTLAGGCFDGTCHTAGNEGNEGNISTEYYLATRDGVTHVMTTTLTGTGSGNPQVAWVSSDKCKSCHSAGPFYTEANSFPHRTPSNAQFLRSYPTANQNLDAVCMDCHTDTGVGGSYTSGVGKTF